MNFGRSDLASLEIKLATSQTVSSFSQVRDERALHSTLSCQVSSVIRSRLEMVCAANRPTKLVYLSVASPLLGTAFRAVAWHFYLHRQTVSDSGSETQPVFNVRLQSPS